MNALDRNRGSRFREEIEFAVGLPEEGWGEAAVGEAPEWLVEILYEAIERDPQTEINHFPSGIGRGADGVAIGIEILSVMSSAATVFQTACWLFRRLRSTGNEVVLSIGAAEAMCRADILRDEPSLGFDDLHLLTATEAVPPGQGVDTNHTGQDLFVLIFHDSENTRSWTYLIDSHGRVFHCGVGAPIPAWRMYWENNETGVMPGPEAESARYLNEGDFEEEE